MHELLDFLLEPYRYKAIHDIILEALTFVFGIASVWLARKTNVLAYPVGLVATVITTYLLYEVRYFGDMMVNAYFSVMSLYGWYKWGKQRDDGSTLAISRTDAREKWIGAGLFFLTIFVIFAIYALTGTQVRTANYFDILTSGLFFTAMWLMALKKIENWTLWIIGDLIAVPLYWHRDLGILALEYVVFTILAITAYFEWRRQLRRTPIS